MHTEIVEHDPAAPNDEVNEIALAEAKLRHYILGSEAPVMGITQGEALEALRTFALAVAFWRSWWMPILCGGMVIGAGIVIGVLKLTGGAP